MEWPDNFRPQVNDHMKEYADLVGKGQSALFNYFKAHPDKGEQLLLESYDKRYSPSTFIEEYNDGYRVGWYEDGYQCAKQHLALVDAVTDYVLFSYGFGRFNVS